VVTAGFGATEGFGVAVAAGAFVAAGDGVGVGVFAAAVGAGVGVVFAAVFAAVGVEVGAGAVLSDPATGATVAAWAAVGNRRHPLTIAAVRRAPPRRVLRKADCLLDLCTVFSSLVR
jgi:hypothetical protein